MSAIKEVINVECPNCGGIVPIYNRFSHIAVCDYCHSVVVYGEDAVKVRGKMSVLPAGRIKIPLYATGKIQGKEFIVLGRIRYEWERGVWDEYYIGFDDGSTMWLTEDDAELYLENVGTFPKGHINWEEINVGDRIELVGKEWLIIEKNTAKCVGGEGQLPFELVLYEEIKFFECESGDEIGTYEYDEDGEKFYYGKLIKYSDLHLPEPEIPGEVITAKPASVKDITQISGKVRPLTCKSCGGAMEVETKNGIPEYVKCPYCGFVESLKEKTITCPNCQNKIELKSGDEASSVLCDKCNSLIAIDTGVKVLKQINDVEKFLKSQLPISVLVIREAIPLGTKVEIEGVEYEVIGAIYYYYNDRLQEEDGYYVELMLFNPTAGYLWLEMEDGHWSYGRKIPADAIKYLSTPKRVIFEGQKFDFYHGNPTSTIVFVEGELPWIAKIGDRSYVEEFANPPYLIAIEKTQNEMEVYLMKYFPREELLKALKIPEDKKQILPRPSSWPPPNKPYSEVKRTLIKTSFLFAVLSFILMLFAFITSKQVYSEKVPLKLLANKQKPYTLNNGKPIDTKQAKLLTIDMKLLRKGSINFWVYIAGEIGVPEIDEPIAEFGKELSYYEGYDADGHWTEDETEKEVSLKVKGFDKIYINTYLDSASMNVYNYFINDMDVIFIIKKDYLDPYPLVLGTIIFGGIAFLLFMQKNTYEAKRLGTYEENDDD